MAVPEITVVAPLVQKVASGAAYVGGGTLILGGLNANEIAILCGAFVGVGGFLVSWYYKHKQFKLWEKRIEQLTLKDLTANDG